MARGLSVRKKTHNPSGGIKMFATSLCLLLELEHMLFFGPAGEGKNSISLSAVEVLRFQSEHQNIHCLLRFSIDHHPDHRPDH